jgi:RNA polymerase sigma-70 factor (ECF subfamily)
MSQNNLYDLLILAQSGDKYAYSQLLTECSKYIGQKIRKWITRPEVAEELTQEVLIGIHRNLQTFLPGKSAEAWIMGITRFKVIDYFRKNPHKFQSLESDVTTPEEFTNNLMETLDELPELLREALIMTKVEGLSTKEAAQRLSIKENALRTRLSRAMSRLKKELIS